MKKFLAGLCFLFALLPNAGEASDALQAELGEDILITLFTTPCLVKQINEEVKTHPEIKVFGAEVSLHGESRQACWAEVFRNGKIIAYAVVDEKGEGGAIDSSYFKPVSIN